MNTIMALALAMQLFTQGEQKCDAVQYKLMPEGWYVLDTGDVDLSEPMPTQRLQDDEV